MWLAKPCGSEVGGAGYYFSRRLGSQGTLSHIIEQIYKALIDCFCTSKIIGVCTFTHKHTNNFEKMCKIFGQVKTIDNLVQESQRYK